ncbi:MAG TPA: glycogen-binding domain-containing protein [Pyrinomonadaceae bacterium]
MMRKSFAGVLLIVALASHFADAGARARQSRAKAEDRKAEALKEYAGRYELEVGLIPVSTLDVTAAGGELWMKPSNVKRRRLARKGKDSFADEVAGTPVSFGRDDEGHVVSLAFVYEGETYTARRVELPAPSSKGNTTFTLKGHEDASVVVLVGTFNNWNQSQLLFAREADGWVCRVDLDPGVYQYKFIVDGDWLLDPSNPDTAEDEAGNVNTVIEVRGK